jgi:hypothetical protein
LVSFLLQQSTTTITFPPENHKGEPDEAISVRFDPAWDECTSGVLAHRNTPETAKACQRAAMIADEYKAENRMVQRRMAYVYAATAFANIADWKSALPFADKAVMVVKQSHETGSGAEAAYETRSQIKAFSGDLTGAAPDADLADGFAREMVKQGLPYGGQQLKKDLIFHAELLRRSGQPDAANKLQNEADKL